MDLASSRVLLAWGSFERRRRRLIAAQRRLEEQGYTLSGIFNLAKDHVRLKADPQLLRDVFAVLNMGFASDAEMDEGIGKDCVVSLIDRFESCEREVWETSPSVDIE